MQEHLISVIIPVYNVEKYLSQCLDSVISQTYRNLEIIIIDDGSTDGSGTICDEYNRKDSRIQVFHTENHGLATARNAGMEKATGEYLFFVDSDDWLELNALEVLLKTADEYDADIVKASYCREYAGKTKRSKRNDPSQVFRGADILTAYTHGILGDVVWNKLYKTSVFNGICFPDGHNHEDIAATWKLMKKLSENKGAAFVLSDVLFHHRFRVGSISQTKSCQNAVDLWNARKTAYENIPDFRLISGCFYAIGGMWLKYGGYSKEEKKKAHKTIEEMNAFSRTHFREVMKGMYSPTIKAICLVSQCKCPVLLQVCFLFGKVRRALILSWDKRFD